MVFKRIFKDKPSDIEVSPKGGRTPWEAAPLVHQLADRLRGTFDLDEILQLVANGLGEHLKADHCLIYLCDPNVDTLRWRAGYQQPELAPLRWPLRESDFPELFARLRRGEQVRISDPLHDELVASCRSRFEAAGVRTLLFVPARSDNLEAVIIIGQVKEPRLLSDSDREVLETVAAQVAVAARHVTISSALRRAGAQVQSATAELQTENQQLQGLIQLLLLPAANLEGALNHISQALCDLYHLKACSIEEIQGEVTNVLALCCGGSITNLGVFAIQGTPRELVLGPLSAGPRGSSSFVSGQEPEAEDQEPRGPADQGPRVVFNAIDAYPDDRFIQEQGLNFYVGAPITSRSGEVIGLLNLYHQETLELQKRDLKTLSAIARRVGLEIEQERHFRARAQAEHEIQWRLEAASQWEEQLKFLQEARELLRLCDTLEAGLQDVIVAANQHVGSDFAAIALYDVPMASGERRKANLEVNEDNSPSEIRNPKFKQLITAGIEPAVREAIGHLPTGKGLLGVLADWTGPLRLDNVMQHPQFTGFPSGHPVVRSFLAVPLRVRGHTVGALYFADKQGGEPFSTEDEWFASQLAAQVALAVAAPPSPRETPNSKPQAPNTGIWDLGFGASLEEGWDSGGGAAGALEFVWNLVLGIGQEGGGVEGVCARVADEFREFFPGSELQIWLLDPSRQGLFLVPGPQVLAIVPGQESGVLAEDQGPGTPDQGQSGARGTRDQFIPLGEGLIGQAALSGQKRTLKLDEATGQWVNVSMEERGNGGMGEREKGEMREGGNGGKDFFPVSPFPFSPIDPLIRSATIVPLKSRQVTLGVMVVLSPSSLVPGPLSLVPGEEDKGPGTTGSRPLKATGPGDQFLDVVAYCLGSYIDQVRRNGTTNHTNSREIPNSKPQIPKFGIGDWGLGASPFMETLLENSDSGIVAISRDATITVFNPAMERLTGYRRSEVLGLSLVPGPSSLVPALKQEGFAGPRGEEDKGPRGSEGARERGSEGATHATIQLFARGQPLQDAIWQGRVIHLGDAEVLTRGGAKKPVSLTSWPLSDEHGALLGALGVVTDLTRIRTLEHELSRLTPLALIGEMSARLAHEIKNPLASMMSGLELLKRRAEGQEREGHYFDRLMAELARLDTTVREMLSYGHSRAPAFVEVDPVEPLQRALDRLGPQLERAHIAAERDIQRGLPRVLMDANQMEQVFLNLVLNAIDAMPDGGTLHCGLRMANGELEEEQLTMKDDQSDPLISRIPRNLRIEIIEYTISDTGVGIPSEVIDKIFDPFFSTKPHGTGLGLASVQNILEAHQGQVSVQSAPGQGTTFTIRLPHQPSAEREAAASMRQRTNDQKSQ